MRLLTCYEAQKSGLPTAVWPHHCKPLALCKRSTDVGEQLCVPVMSPPDIFEGQQSLSAFN